MKPPTLDLKATDKTAPAAGSEARTDTTPAEPTSDSPQRSGGAAAGEQATPHDAAVEDGAESAAAASDRAPDRREEAGRRLAGLAAAAATGAILALAVLYGLTERGLWPHPPVAEDAAGPQLDALAARLDEAERELARLPDTTAAPDIDALEDRLVAVEDRIAEGAQEPAARIAELEEAVAALSVWREETIGAPAAEPAEPAGEPVDLGPVEQELAALAERLTALERSVADLEQRPAETGQDISARVAATSLAVRGVTGALDAGESFATELDMLRRLAGDAPAIDALAPLAADGVPSRPALQARFEIGLAEWRGEAGPADEPAAGLWGTISDGARSLVRVRRTAEAGPLAEVEAAVAGGDLAAAHARWQELPDDERAAFADWAAQVEIRLTAERAAADLAAYYASAADDQGGGAAP